MRLFIFSSQKFVLDTLQEKIKGLSVFSHFDELQESLTPLTEDVIVLFDIASFDKTREYLTALQQLHRIKIFALTPQISLSEGLALIPYGIKGYGHILMSKNLLSQALSQIKQDTTWFDPRFVTEMISSLTRKEQDKKIQTEAINKLTPQEQKVAYLVTQGLLNKEIAGKLNITERTAKAHVQSCYRKLGINDRVSLAMLLKDEI